MQFSSVILLLITTPALAISSNSFFFDSNVSISLSFNVTRYAITAGQQWGGVTTTGNQVVVLADRSGSPEVAAQFTDGLDILNMFPTEHVIDGKPADLNFAAIGTLQVRYQPTVWS